MAQQNKVLIACLGLHVQARGWQHAAVGTYKEPGRIVLAMQLASTFRKEGSQPVLHIGTGASRTAEGMLECEALQQAGLQALGEFPKNEKDFLRQVLEKAILARECQNTAQELHSVATTCREHGINESHFVTNRFHAARTEMLIWQTAGVPNHYGIYSSPNDPEGCSWEDVAIVEPPHRGDDPQMQLLPERQRPALVRRMFKVPAHRAANFANDLHTLLGRYGA